jgi:predicted secreted Zn-dependent protease
MRPCFIVALLYAALTLGCSTLTAEPALVQPPRSVPLQIALSNTYDNENVRVIENVWLKPYEVDAGSGLDDIRRELDAIGPVSEVAGRRFDGLTTWALNSSYSFAEGGDSCRVRNATIQIEAVIALPELSDESALPPDELGLWKAYLLQLRAHEDGHVSIYRAGAQELSNEVFALGDMPDCDQLREALAGLREAKIARISQADRNFDLQTGHGATFPAKD